MQSLSLPLSRALDLLFAPTCAACDRTIPSGDSLCDTCAVSLVATGPACPRCALPSAGPLSTLCGACRASPPPYDALHAPFLYGGELARALRRLKFDGRREVARALAPLFAPALVRAATEVDLVIPVPLHRRRLARRGFNQTALLLRHARVRTLAPVDLLSLRRTRATSPQTGLDRTARRRNVDGAFAVVPSRVTRIAGRSILLVDDVGTTGATLAAAARALRAAGAAAVTAFCVARAAA
jgi:ComF family protein